MTGIIPYIFFVTGIFCLYYYRRIFLYCGYGPDFAWFWNAAGACLLMMGTMLRFFILTERKSADTVSLLALFLLAGVFAFFLVSFLILKEQGNREAKDGADYVIILGAKVNGTIPSRALSERIKTAGDYLARNPATKAVLCGGQGKGEHIPEACMMEKELMKRGISKSRLFIESQSTTTVENIELAFPLIGDQHASIVIVTSDFHTKRGKRVARDTGFCDVETIGAPSSRVMRLHYYTRETLSWVKYLITEFLKGNKTGEKDEYTDL